MDKSQLFTLAHHETRKAFLKAKLLGNDFNYQITFSFYLKELVNNQPQKVTTYSNRVMAVSYAKKPKVNKSVAMVGDYKKPKVNKACAMVGDFKKPTIANDSLEMPFFILSVFAILIIFALTLQAINYF